MAAMKASPDLSEETIKEFKEVSFGRPIFFCFFLFRARQRQRREGVAAGG